MSQLAEHEGHQHGHEAHLDDAPVSSAAIDCAHRSPTSVEDQRRLVRVLVLTVIIMVAEAAGGWYANSLALLADAGHMVADAAAIGLAIFAAWAGRRPATAAKTYGYQRLEVLAALANGAALFVIAGLIAWEAVRRWAVPPDIHSGTMLAVATVGLSANIISLSLLHRGHDHQHGGEHDHSHSLNLRGVSLHVLGDLLGSAGALAAAGVIMLTGWTRADPVVSVVIAFLILGSAWQVIKESVDVLLEGAPRHISLSDVAKRISTIPGVAGVHDLHVWTVTSGVVAMSGHAVVAEPSDNQRVLEAVQSRLEEIGIRHVTLQIERDPTCE